MFVHPLSNGFLPNKRQGKKSNHTHYYTLMVQRCQFWPIYRPWNEYHDSNYPLYGWGDFKIFKFILIFIILIYIWYVYNFGYD